MRDNIKPAWPYHHKIVEGPTLPDVTESDIKATAEFFERKKQGATKEAVLTLAELYRRDQEAKK